MHDLLQGAADAIEAATGHLTVEQIDRPVPGAWSIGEILEHLTLSFSACAIGLEKAAASGNPKAGRRTLVRRLWRVLVVDLGYFPRARAAEAVMPRRSVSAENSRQAIHDALVRLDAALARAAERFGDQTPLLKHPYFGGLTVPQWRRFHWRHAVHHMRQVRRRSTAPLTNRPA